MENSSLKLSDVEIFHPFAPQKPIFRGYDIRGDYRYFTNDFLHSLANCLLESFDKTPVSGRIVIGYDMRHGSLNIARYLASTFSKADFEVIWLGLVTTPMMAYWAEQQNKGQKNCIMVTASHSAKNITGIKWIIDGQSPTEADIQSLYFNMSNQAIHIPTHNEMNEQWLSHQSNITIIKHPELAYQQSIHEAIGKIQPQLPMSKINTIVIDCLNGTTANFAKALYAQYAKNVIVLNDTANGDFPKGNPDPCEEGRLDELQSAVIAYKADLGLAFDGDGDRMMVVDNTGNIIIPDNLLYLLAKTALEQRAESASQSTSQPSSSQVPPEVLFDVKCSHHLPNMLTALGARPIMSKTGSSQMRYSMQTGKSKAIFAGELSGHFIYNDGFFINHDDAMYAGIRLLTWLSLQIKNAEHLPFLMSDSTCNLLSLSNIVNKLPTMVSTADTYIKVKERQSLISQLIDILKNWLNNTYIDTSKLLPTSLPDYLPNILTDKLPKDAKLSTVDGIRLDFKNGFGIIRQSNTSQSLTIRFAGNSLSDLKKIQQHFVKICQQLDESLAKSISKIQPITSQPINS